MANLPQAVRPLPRWLAKAMPFARYTLKVNGYRMHYIDQGEGPVVLMQHGNPTWCFLWRKVIEALSGKAIRVIAPDLIGLGLSDAPAKVSTHSLDFHASNLEALVTTLNLQNITLVAQDWGGPIAAVMAARHRARIHGAVFANTAIAQPQTAIRTTAFHRFSHMPVISNLAFQGLKFPLPVMHKVQGNAASIGRFEKRAYGYPLKRLRRRTTALALARMVPDSLSHPTVATLAESDHWAHHFEGPVELVWGKKDPILGPSLKPMKALFPHAPVTPTGAGHFLQEEVPEELAAAILRVVNS